VTLPVLTKFRLLVALDVANFAWPVLLAVLPHRVGFGIAVFIVLIARGIGARAARITEDSRTKRQRLTHAIVVIVGYLIWISGIIYADVRFNNPAAWALSSVFIVLLCVFCYVAVRVNLGLDQPWGTVPPKASNQAMQLTAVSFAINV
jgi:protein-S-isoprenylcysteine O-methyltransferase Ste14